jgi:uncharacterized repeat protein (TIGR02543 family)
MRNKLDYALNFMKIGCIYLITAATLIMLRCGNTSEVSLSGGNSSEVSQVVMGTLYSPDGNQPADNAMVTIRSRDFIPATISIKIMRSPVTYFIQTSRTDNAGHFFFDSIPTGEYIIEGRNSRGECAFIDSVNVDSSTISDTTIVSIDTLKLPSTVTGSHDTTGLASANILIFIPGLDVIDSCDKNGRFTLTDIPEGKYFLHFFMVSGEFSNENSIPITTEAGKTTRIGVTYRVTYTANASDSGVVPVDTMGYFTGDSVIIPKNTSLKRAGYIFTGWNTKPDGSGRTFRPDTVLIMGSEDIQLFAKWTIESKNTQYVMKWIATKGKSFQMGEAGVADTVHTVMFYSNGYWIDSTEVTQSEYEAVMSAAYPGYRRPAWNSGSDPNYPVYNISWYDAVLYCNARTKASGINDTVYQYSNFTGTPGDTDCTLGAVLGLLMNSGYRLPTEAEWEYACRAETSTRYFWGDDTLKAAEYAWYGSNAEQVKPVAQKKPNAFGLYDMSGNAAEICNDAYGIYIQGAVYEPSSPGPITEPNTVTCRGGSWKSDVRTLGSASRGKVLIHERKQLNGFRVCRSVK